MRAIRFDQLTPTPPLGLRARPASPQAGAPLQTPPPQTPPAPATVSPKPTRSTEA